VFIHYSFCLWYYCVNNRSLNSFPTRRSSDLIENQIKEELEEIKSSYNEFHILTYELDEAYQISKIMHYLPNPINNIAYKIEDLSKYILGAELSDEEREIIAPEQGHDILDPTEFDIGIFEETEKKDS